MACAIGLSASQSQAATQILVGQCIEHAICWTGSTPTAWSDTLSMTQLDSLANGDLVVSQTAESVIRLGVTTADFSTPGGPVIERWASSTVPEVSRIRARFRRVSLWGRLRSRSARRA
jgi:hypothetical protein